MALKNIYQKHLVKKKLIEIDAIKSTFKKLHETILNSIEAIKVYNKNASNVFKSQI